MVPIGNGGTFKTTAWTVILDAPHDPASLEEFVTTYWPPVYAYVRRTGRSSDDAADLTQSFFAALLENPRFMISADRKRGRFRSYLLVAVKNFIVDERRREHGHRPVRTKPLAIDHSMLEKIEPSEADDPALAFDRQWATMVLDAAIRRLEQACASDGNDASWKVFEQRVLIPASRGHAPAPIEEMIAELGASSPQEVYSMVQTMKRRLQRELLGVVCETLDDPAEAPRELADLMRALAKPRG